MAFVRLEHIVSAEDVARKWGVDSQTLGEITRIDKIYVYSLRDTRQLPDGKKIYLCSDPYAQGMPYEEDFGRRIYDLSLYVFNLEDIEKYETAHPEYLLPQAAEDQDEYIPAKELRKELRLSPVQFVDYLREHRGLCLFGTGIDDSSREWFYNNSSREQAAGILDDMYIHRLDIVAHKKNVAEAIEREDTPFIPIETKSAESPLPQNLWVEIKPYIFLGDLLGSVYMSSSQNI